MTQLIAVDPNALDTLAAEIARLHRRLDEIEMKPKPEWVTVEEFAKIINKSKRTVTRRIEAGLVQSTEIAGVRMVHVRPSV